MLEVLLAIIDRLILLTKGRIEGRRQVFREVLEPVFNDLLAVHGDYIETFEAIRQTFPGHYKTQNGEMTITPGIFGTPTEDSPEYKVKLLKAKQLLARKRLEFEPIRIKLRALASQLDQLKVAKEEERFIKAVLNYFPSANLQPRTTNYTSFLEFLDDEQNGFLIEDTIDRLVEGHKKSWSEVCEAYAPLRIVIAQLR